MGEMLMKQGVWCFIKSHKKIFLTLFMMVKLVILVGFLTGLIDFKINALANNTRSLPHNLNINSYNLTDFSSDIKLESKTKVNEVVAKTSEVSDNVVKEEVVTKKTKKVTNKVEKKTTKPVKKLTIKEKINADTKKLGTSGRLYFPSMTSFALYKTSVYDENIQKIVDKKDSAANFDFNGANVIGDHSNQGFSIIKSLKVGSKVYIKIKVNGKVVIKTYQVTEKTNGTNTGVSLITNDKRRIEDVKASLVMYTCNSLDGKKVTIVFLKEI